MTPMKAGSRAAQPVAMELALLSCFLSPALSLSLKTSYEIRNKPAFSPYLQIHNRFSLSNGLTRDFKNRCYKSFSTANCNIASSIGVSCSANHSFIKYSRAPWENHLDETSSTVTLTAGDQADDDQHEPEMLVIGKIIIDEFVLR